jgi:hypothetical protein
MYLSSLSFIVDDPPTDCSDCELLFLFVSLSLFSYVYPENVTLVASMKPIAVVVASAASFVSDVHGEHDLALALYQRAATFVQHIGMW